MRIESHGVGADRLTGVGASQTAGASDVGQANDRRTGGTDGVDLSNRAKEIRSAQKAIGDLPDVREDRVAALKTKIASGQYNPSPEDIARKMLGM